MFSDPDPEFRKMERGVECPFGYEIDQMQDCEDASEEYLGEELEGLRTQNEALGYGCYLKYTDEPTLLLNLHSGTTSERHNALCYTSSKYCNISYLM